MPVHHVLGLDCGAASAATTAGRSASIGVQEDLPDRRESDTLPNPKEAGPGQLSVKAECCDIAAQLERPQASAVRSSDRARRAGGCGVKAARLVIGASARGTFWRVYPHHCYTE